VSRVARDGFLQLKIEGPQGRVISAQIAGNLSKMRASWLPDTFRAFGRYMREVVMNRQFGREGAYLGRRWANIDGRYRMWKIGIFGGQADYIGRRSLALRHALTSADAKPFNRAGPPGKTIRAVPILDYSASHVTVGASVTETPPGEEYSVHFDAARPIFGDGKLPAEVEIEGGKLLSLAYMAATHTKEGGEPSYTDFPDAAITKYLSVRALRAAAA